MVNNFFFFFTQVKVLKDDGKQFYLFIFFTQVKVLKDDGKQFYLFIFYTSESIERRW